MNPSVKRTPLIMTGINQRYVVKNEEYVLSKLSYPEKIDEMGALRIQAWKNEQGVSKSFFSNVAWIDEQDKNAHHWVISTEGNIVASARLSFHESYATVPHSELFDEKDLGEYNKGPFASLNRLVVNPQFRGKGFSSLLDEVRVGFARELGAKIIVAQPIETRIRSLQELGFILIGKIKPLEQMPDRQLFFMVKDLDTSTDVEY